jgi:integrase
LFIGIATGRRTPLSPHIDAWAKAYAQTVEPKTADMAKSEVARFVDKFPTLDMVTRKAVAGWSRERTETGAKAASIRRAVSALRAFWSFLQDNEVAPEDVLPFAKVPVGERSKDAAKTGYRDFTPKDVARLHHKAQTDDDGDLSDLIAMAAYTGARIEELCSLSLGDCVGGALTITDAKSAAGNRQVPVHGALEELLGRRKGTRTTGYLFADLTSNKYGDRSNAIGKRFGRLKTAMGFEGRQWAFHSIRKTVTTQFERAGIGENVVADIVGHDKPRITYGVYSGGTTMQQRRKAVAVLSYSGTLQKP